VDFKTVEIDNVAHDEFLNLSVDEIIREKLVKNYNILILYLLNKMSKFIAVK
jgi:hypothetical protein